MKKDFNSTRARPSCGLNAAGWPAGGEGGLSRRGAGGETAAPGQRGRCRRRRLMARLLPVPE